MASKNFGSVLTPDMLAKLPRVVGFPSIENKNPSLKVSKLLIFKLSKFQSFKDSKTLRFQDSKITRCKDSKIPRSQVFKVSKIQNIISCCLKDIDLILPKCHFMFSGRCSSHIQDFEELIRQVFGIVRSPPVRTFFNFHSFVISRNNMF